MHEGGVRSVRLKDLSLIEEGVDEVRICVEAMAECRVNDFKHHQQDLLKDSPVGCLRGNRVCVCVSGKYYIIPP